MVHAPIYSGTELLLQNAVAISNEQTMPLY
jgi:hypothetical protein